MVAVPCRFSAGKLSDFGWFFGFFARALRKFFGGFSRALRKFFGGFARALSKFFGGFARAKNKKFARLVDSVSRAKTMSKLFSNHLRG